ncbi:MAG: HEPN family nuclease [Phototrophicaceae bacterium]
MMPSDKVMITLARRTKHNLDFIYARKDSGDVYEFTQLVNSMLSLVISMRAEYFSERSQVSWAGVETAVRRDMFEAHVDIDALTQIVGDEASEASPKLRQIQHFSELIDCLRNAFAHCCFELLEDTFHNINGVRVWNVRVERDRMVVRARTWQAEISESQLRDIAYVFIAYLEATRGHEVPKSA